ncbi:MAG: cupin domain-containing protein [Syntrophales bacterium]|jgi:cupin 2 domain-containing protein|nr:cupin domain-containing protein [Syntrophales bacterium]
MSDGHGAGNLFSLPSSKGRAELFEELFRGQTYRVERICSRGQASPPGFWYDQDHAEWVLLLQGSAGLQFAGEEERLLVPGDYILIKPHEKHRVNWTAPEQTTVWLAIHEIPQEGTA